MIQLPRAHWPRVALLLGLATIAAWIARDAPPTDRMLLAWAIVMAAGLAPAPTHPTQPRPPTDPPNEE